MNEFQFVCLEKDLEENECKKFEVDLTDVVLIKKEGKFYALSNRCTHHHVSVMDRGDLEGDYLVCPNHFWRFDIKTGKKDGTLRGLDKYEVKTEDGKVFVKVVEKELNW